MGQRFERAVDILYLEELWTLFLCILSEWI